jgi:hypothetical protein
MLTFITSGSNVWTLRVQPTGSSNLTLYLQDMITLENYSASLSNYNYDAYESKLSFTSSQVTTLVSSSVGTQYRAYISDTTCSIWNGSVSVFTSQSLNKSGYVNQIPLENVYISRVSDNEYIILD